MSTPADPRESTRYTWSDYRSRGDEERREIIDSAPYAMAPAPPTEHQGIVLRLSARVERGLAGGACRPFIAPADLRLADTDVVPPGILVVCDPAKITATDI